MMMINDSTAVIYTPAELSDAVGADNGVDYVYLGADIAMTAGIRIHPAKTSLVIDGRHPPDSANFYTLTDSGSNTGQIYIDSSQNLDLVFQNLIISGRNYYGMPRVYDYSGAENVTVTYQNVTYNGPQTIYHIRGLARYVDCDITIRSNGYSPAEEVAQINRVEIGGKTVMRKSNQGNAIFWFFGSGTRRPYFKVLSGADAEISTAHYFMYESYPPDYIIEPDAKFALHTDSGISYDSGHTAASFLVGENASFYYTQAANSRDAATIYIDGALTVNEGAVFYMQADFENNFPIIRCAGSAAGIYITNPKSFVLYNSGTGANAAAFYFYPAPPYTPFILSGGQLNFWSSATAFPTAGTFYDIPHHKWHKPEWDVFTITGAASNSSTMISGTSFTEEELEELPSLSHLQLGDARVISVGSLPLEVNAVVAGAPVTGVTEPGAYAYAEYSSEGTAYSTEATADSDGSFLIIAAPHIPFAALVTISANTPFLITRIARAAQEDGELAIVEAPEHIRFGIRPMPEFPGDLILPRQVPEAPVIVSDTRAEKTYWQLWARITGPLTTDENDVLNDTVVFVRQDGTIAVLSDDFAPVHVGVPFTEAEESVVWNADKGVLVCITGPMRSGKQYSTQLIWEVRPLEG